MKRNPVSYDPPVPNCEAPNSRTLFHLAWMVHGLTSLLMNVKQGRDREVFCHRMVLWADSDPSERK